MKVLTTIDILGSCVTRDAFKYDGENVFRVNQYYARSSLISLYSKSVNITLNDINLESNFQKRMVYNDLTNAFRKYIKNKTGDYLMIDFIDERMSILKSGDSYITRSREFINSKSNLKGTLLTGSEKLNKWKQSALIFSEEISKYYNGDKIILHKALWKEQYITKDGDIKTFEDKTIAENNELLMQYYSFIEENLKGIKVIELEDFNASEAHVWSLAPYHYQDEYYIEFMKQLKSLTKNN